MTTDPSVPFIFLTAGYAEASKVEADFDALIKYIKERNNGTAQWDYIYVLNNISLNNLSPVAPLHIGSLSGTSHLFNILSAKSFSTAASNAHAIAECSTFSGNAGTSFAGYDCSSATAGSNNYGHLIGFQTAITHGSSGTLTDLYDFGATSFNNGGVVTNRYGFYVVEGSGSGTITNQYGLYVEGLTKGGTLNYAVYTAGTTPSQFGGSVTITKGSPNLNITDTGTGPADLLFRTNSAAHISAIGAEGSASAIFTGSTAYAMVMGTGTNHKVQFFSNDTKRLEISESGSIVPGTAALATNATNGFTYIQTCAGTPTGTPTTFAGRVAMVFDTTNKKFYIYSGSWLGGTTPGVFA